MKKLFSFFVLGCFSAGVGGVRADENLGWHIVRPGDTLERITALYLGSQDRWRENHALNLEIEDPDFLRPGERIRVLLADTLPENAALVTAISGEVDEQPSPITWRGALTEDLLREGDGVRTDSGESLRLTFPDNSFLIMTEDSLVFLAKLGGRGREVRRDALEIQRGQADFTSSQQRAPTDEIEILVGGAVAVAQGQQGSASKARARRSVEGGAELMIYAGKAEVESAGEKVEVPEGMGTAVPKGGPPSPPEKLLPAPKVELPTAGSELFTPSPMFTWRPVEGAASYVCEVCSDSGCAKLVRRETGVQESGWRPEKLPKGSYYWRATAVSPSGLDGYPAAAQPFTIVSDVIDDTAPTGSLDVVSGAIRVGGRLYLGPDAKIEVATGDVGSGVDHWLPRRDGSSHADAWDDLASPGEHTLSLEIVDRAGHRTLLEPLHYLGDGEPPVLSWERVGPEYSARFPERSRRELKRNASGLEWATESFHWKPMTPRSSRKRGAKKRDGAGTSKRWTIRSLAPDLFIAIHRAGIFAEDTKNELENGQIVRIRVSDAGAGVEKIEFGVVDGGFTFVATDLLGNSTTWSLALANP